METSTIMTSNSQCGIIISNYKCISRELPNSFGIHKLSMGKHSLNFQHIEISVLTTHPSVNKGILGCQLVFINAKVWVSYVYWKDTYSGALSNSDPRIFSKMVPVCLVVLLLL